MIDGQKKNQFKLETKNFSIYDGSIDAGQEVFKKRKGNETVMNFDPLVCNADQSEGSSEDEGKHAATDLHNLPDLVKYNDQFAQGGQSKRKAKQREKVMEMLNANKDLIN